MPNNYLVHQPNGQYAIWSTADDKFLALNIVRTDTDMMLSAVNGVPLGEAAQQAAIEIANITATGIAWPWALNWNGCLDRLENLHRAQELDKVERLRLTGRVKNAPPLKAAQYWARYWQKSAQEWEAKYQRLKAEREVKYQVAGNGD